jgi:hypothetical protein
MDKPIDLEANRKWNSIAKEISQKIESNVWCSNCMDAAVMIKDYQVDLLGKG